MGVRSHLQGAGVQKVNEGRVHEVDEGKGVQEVGDVQELRRRGKGRS